MKKFFVQYVIDHGVITKVIEANNKEEAKAKFLATLKPFFHQVVEITDENEAISLQITP